MLGLTWWCHQMETFSALLAICAGSPRSPVNSPHKGQWRGALMFSLICVWINSWVNNREVGDLRCYRAQYDVILLSWSTLHKSLMTGRHVGKYTGQSPWCLSSIYSVINKCEINCKYIVMADLIWWCIFVHLTARLSTDGKRAPLTASDRQPQGSLAHMYNAVTESFILLSNNCC